MAKPEPEPAPGSLERVAGIRAMVGLAEDWNWTEASEVFTRVQQVAEDEQASAHLIHWLASRGMIEMLVALRDQATNAAGVIERGAALHRANAQGANEAIRLVGIGILVFGATSGIDAFGVWTVIALVLGFGVTLAGSTEVERSLRAAADEGFRRDGLVRFAGLIDGFMATPRARW